MVAFVCALLLLRTTMVRLVCAFLLVVCPVAAFIPLIDGGKGMPALYNGWLNEQLSKQAASAVSRVSRDLLRSTGTAATCKVEQPMCAREQVDGTDMPLN